jgi:glyoxylase-like metal-dependent hydrolase (beta-lactamase superfamily II)
VVKWQYTKGMHDLGNGLWAYLLPDGSWGWSNAGLVADGDHSLLVDTLFDLRLTAEMLANMRRAVPAAERIGTLVNTHANGDHCFGNQLVEGAEIVATEATRDDMHPDDPKRMRQIILNAHQLGRGAELLAELFQPFDFRGIRITRPHRVFAGELDLKVGDKLVRLIEVGPAHTRGDLLVHVPEEHAVFTGDILFNEATPVAWVSVLNWIAACDRILAMDIDIVVPGHGPITDKGGVRNMRSYLKFIADEARMRFDAGMAVQDAAFDIRLGQYAAWGDPERLAVNVHTLFEEYRGARSELNVLALWEQMSLLREKLRREAGSAGPTHQF